MGGISVNLDSKFQPKKCAKRDYGDDDWISRLPDDILVVILSSLPLKEAARTSVLSSRWINLWRHTSCLNFDADSALHKIAKQNELRNVERRKYVKWVNSVLHSHKGLTLEEFRICFDLDRSARKAITKWLEFAFARQVQRLEMEFLEYGDFERPREKMYAFPEEFLSQSSSGASTMQHPSDNSCIPHPRTLFNVKSLKALCLKSVEVTGEAIEFFLRHCPLLEQLIVHGSDKISTLKVCGSSLVLKHLEIYHCYCLKSIKVSAPNLTSLKVMTLEGLLLENVPMLVEVSLMCGFADIYEEKLVRALHCCISQLEILTLKLYSSKEIVELCEFPQLPKLKKLEIEYFAKGDQSLIGLTSFIRASPYLQEFEVKLIWYRLSRTSRQVKNAMHFPHQHLKVVKFSGYYGRTSDIELVRYILVNCVVLEKIIIDPRYQPGFSHTPVDPEYMDVERTTRNYAKQQLEADAPQHIELVIL